MVIQFQQLFIEFFNIAMYFNITDITNVNLITAKVSIFRQHHAVAVTSPFLYRKTTIKVKDGQIRKATLRTR